MLGSSSNNLIRGLLDLLFPPTERQRRVRKLSKDDIPRLSKERYPKKDFIKAVCDYKNETVRDIVGALKYDGSRAAAELIGRILQEELLAVCVDKRVFADKIVIVPVPLSKKRQRQRGFNQTARIAKAVIRNDETNTFETKHILKKICETPSQTQLSKTDRRRNLSDAFKITNPAAIENKTVIITDDVTTTGTTFLETRKTLLEANPERVLCVAFAH